MSRELRKAVLDARGALAPGADAAPMIALYRANVDAFHDALGEVPGVDAVRATILRLLPAVLADAADQAPLLEVADAALVAFVEGDDAARGPGGVARHPAWLGLTVLELAERRGEPAEEALRRALELARAGFAHAAPGATPEAGELLWALAEAAGEVGWSDRADPLLDAAAVAPFSDPDNRGRVRLLLVFRALDAGADQDAADRIDALLAEGPWDHETQVQAWYIGAQLDRARGDVARALARLDQALEAVDADEEPEVHARLVGTRATLTPGEPGSA